MLLVSDGTSIGPVKKRSLGLDGPTVSTLGLGCMGFSQAYGPANDDQSIATLRRAIDLGVGLLDTAMSYGAGHNEQLVGRAVAGRREQVVLATKFGIVRGDDGSVRVDGRARQGGQGGFLGAADDLDRLETIAPPSAWAGDRQSFAAHRTTRTTD